MTWWILQSSRLHSEKAGIADLEGSVEWLHIGKWQANSELNMCLDFKIIHQDKEFSLKMVFPSVFPDAPPMVYTEDGSRISQHQYGADGELCLEYRPDNWMPSITGADMIASCHRLIVEERPESGKIEYARSAHVASLGRDLRSKHWRFIMTDADLDAVNSLAENTPVNLTLRDRNVASASISSIKYIGDKETPLWTSDLVVPTNRSDDAGFVLRITDISEKSSTKPDELRNFLQEMNQYELAKDLLDSDSWVYLLIGNSKRWELFLVYGDPNDRKIIPYKTVHVPQNSQRLPNGFNILAEKKVGIVGCGSMGSKIAASLCRCGVGRFLLIDEDIFFPGNEVRNELDLGDVGAHKSYALKDRLLKLNPHSEIKALRITLGGQESSESMVGALEALGECDLLVDATANPKAFNLISSVSTRKKKPIVWAEVFAGGIGGFVARARPDYDPVPLSARGQIETWCNDQGVEWIRPENPGRYDGVGEDGQALIADDAEVSIIASHLTRFATDILARPEASIFPESAYIVGFSSEWLFNQPFHTLPIDLKPDGLWGEPIDALEPEAILQLLKEHLPSKEKQDEVTDAESSFD